MTKSLANRLYMKQRLYSFKIGEDMSISDQMDDFIKILDDLENIEVKLEDQDKALILLNSLPRSYEKFKNALLYGREQSIALEEVQSAIKAKELQKRIHAQGQTQGESLNNKGRPEKTKQKGTKNRSRSKSNTKYKCYLCRKEGHFNVTIQNERK